MSRELIYRFAVHANGALKKLYGGADRELFKQKFTSSIKTYPGMLSLRPGVSVLDGGFGSLLEKEGVDIRGDPLWGASALITNPRKVIDVHKRYLAAGADIIETDSYQAALPTLRAHFGKDSEIQSDAVVRESARLARQAVMEFCVECDRQPEEFLIAGSIGPYATVLHDGSEYSGGYINAIPREEILAYFRGQMNELLKAGVQLLAFETVPTLAEAKIILEVLNTSSPVFAWISFTCKDDTFTQGGDNFADVVTTLSANPALSMIGINCTAPQYVTPLLKKGAHSSKPFVIYSNSGEKWDHDKGWLSSDEPDPVPSYIPEWVSHGAKVIGGCCRIGPDGIRDIAQAVAKLPNFTM